MSDKQDQSASGDGDTHAEEDLTTILDDSQREDLTLLICNITKSMRRVVTDNFDAAAALDPSLLREGKVMSEEEKLMSAPMDSEELERVRNEKDRKDAFERDLSSDEMKALRESAIKAYDQWRESVVRRVGQVANSEEIAKTQLERDSRPDQSTSGADSEVTDTPKFQDMYPRMKTTLTKLGMDKRRFILHSILLLLLSLEHYNAPSRILMLNLTSSLKMPLSTFEQDEYTTAKGLLEAAREMTADEETKKKAEQNKSSRRWKVGLASAAGAAIVGVTGGLAAPLLAAGVGSIMGGLGLGATAAAGYLGSVAGSSLVIGGLFGAYGGRMTGKMMDRYAKEVEDFELIPIHSRNKTSEEQTQGAKEASEHDHKLRVTLCVSGWLTEKEEVVKPWSVISNEAEVFALKYELEALLNLGHSMDGIVKSAAWSNAKQQQTLFSDAAKWPVGLSKVSRVLDGPFSIAKSRSNKAGEVLADALINKIQGERPVTLVGYSFGAQVIHACLKSLAVRNVFGLVEHVVMMGSPTTSDTNEWRMLRSAVSGRLVNVYSESDTVLEFMCRGTKDGVAGMQKIETIPGVENVDVGEEIKAHPQYRFLIGSILRKAGFRDINSDAVGEQHVALKEAEKQEQEEASKSQRKQLQRRNTSGGKKDEAAEGEQEASELQTQIEDKTRKSLTTRVIEWFYTPKGPSATDARNVVGNAGNRLQQVAQDPTKSGDVATGAVQDVQRSTESYVQWLAGSLPSMPGKTGPASKKMAVHPPKTTDTLSKTAAQPSEAVSGVIGDLKKTAADPSQALKDVSKTDPSKALEDVSKTASSATAPARSYVSKAASYLPGMTGQKPAASRDSAQDPRKVANTATASGLSQAGDMANVTASTLKKGTKGIPGTKTSEDLVASATDSTSKATSATRQASDNATSAGKMVGDAIGSVSDKLGQTAPTVPGGKAGGDNATSATDTAKKATSSVVGQASDTATSAGQRAGDTIGSVTDKAGLVASNVPGGKAAADAATSATDSVNKATYSAVGQASDTTSAAGKQAGTALGSAVKTTQQAASNVPGGKAAADASASAPSGLTNAASSLTGLNPLASSTVPSGSASQDQRTAAAEPATSEPSKDAKPENKRPGEKSDTKPSPHPKKKAPPKLKRAAGAPKSPAAAAGGNVQKASSDARETATGTLKEGGEVGSNVQAAAAGALEKGGEAGSKAQIAAMGALQKGGEIGSNAPVVATSALKKGGSNAQAAAAGVVKKGSEAGSSAQQTATGALKKGGEAGSNAATSALKRGAQAGSNAQAATTGALRQGSEATAGVQKIGGDTARQGTQAAVRVQQTGTNALKQGGKSLGKLGGGLFG